jgi:hypothetical protein
MKQASRHVPHSRRPIRVAPVPRVDPPYDDDVDPRDAVERDRTSIGSAPVRAPVPAPVQGALALAFTLPSGLPAVPSVASGPPRFRVVGRDLAQRGSSRTSVGPPDAARWAAMVVQAAVEVVAGDRPLSQMVRWTTPEVYEQLQWRRRRLDGKAGSRGGLASSSRRAVVSSVHVCQPDDDVAEACATVRIGERASAVAVRLETDRDSWRCTAIALG